MQKYLRITVLTGALMLVGSPLFASGPGDGDPPPPPAAATTTLNGTSATAAAISVLLSYLGL